MGKCLNFGLFLINNLCGHQGIHCDLTTKVDFSCNSPDSNFTFSIEDTMLLRDEIENYSFKMTAIFPSGQ